MTRVHQVAVGRRALRRGDRAGAGCGAAARASAGSAAAIHAAAIDPRVRRADRAARRGSRAAAGDLLLIHYSAYVAAAAAAARAAPAQAARLPQRHARPVLLDHHAGRGRRVRAGARPAAARSRARPTWRAADSRFNAERAARRGRARARASCRSCSTPARLEPRGAARRRATGPLVLAVGRLAPHKRHDLVIRAFAACTSASTRRGARLLCVGEPLTPSYRARLERRSRPSRAPRGVTLAGGLAQPDLNAALRGGGRAALAVRARGLLRAAARGVPLRGAGGGAPARAAMPEVGGDAVLWDATTTWRWRPSCSSSRSATTELRGELARRGRARLEEYSLRAHRAGRDRDGRAGPAMSEAYDPDNLLDRHTARSTMELQYEHMFRREAELLSRRLGLRGGDVLSVGCGWNPGRHAFPAPGVADDRGRARGGEAARAGRGGRARRGAGRAGGGAAARARRASTWCSTGWCSTTSPSRARSRPCSMRRRRLLRPGGALVAVEPGSWHPVGAGLAAANRARSRDGGARHARRHPAVAARLVAEARDAGLEPELHAVTYSWRRMPAGLQRALWPVDSALGSPRARGAARPHADADRAALDG